jgi:hypothetical protein
VFATCDETLGSIRKFNFFCSDIMLVIVSDVKVFYIRDVSVVECTPETSCILIPLTVVNVNHTIGRESHCHKVKGKY